MDARSVDQHNLRAGLPLALRHIDNTLDSVASGLRLRRDDRQLLADESIEQRGLAGVGATEDANETGAERHRKGRLAASSYLLAGGVGHGLQYPTKNRQSGCMTEESGVVG